MPSHVCVTALSPTELTRIRTAGIDDFGNPLQITNNVDAGGTPLRCCLREAAVGERVALLAWQPSALPGPDAEVGPVFVHVQPCPGWTGHGYPEGFRHRQQLLRCYDEHGRAIHNQIVEGGKVETVLHELLSRTDVAFVHSRNVLAGCYLFQATRAG